MNVQIHPGNARMAKDAEEQVLTRLHFALDRLSHRIRSVRVQFDDLNGPKGGIDTRCTIEAVLDHHDPLVVEVTDESVVAAATRAARKLVRRVGDESDRARDLRRRDSGTRAAGNGD